MGLLTAVMICLELLFLSSIWTIFLESRLAESLRRDFSDRSLCNSLLTEELPRIDLGYTILREGVEISVEEFLKSRGMFTTFMGCKVSGIFFITVYNRLWGKD